MIRYVSVELAGLALHLSGYDAPAGGMGSLLLPVKLLAISAKNQRERDIPFPFPSSPLKTVYSVSALLGGLVGISSLFIGKLYFEKVQRLLGGAQALMGIGITISYCKEKRMDRGACALVVILTALDAYFGSRTDFVFLRKALWVGTTGYTSYVYCRAWKSTKSN